MGRPEPKVTSSCKQEVGSRFTFQHTISFGLSSATFLQLVAELAHWRACWHAPPSTENTFYPRDLGALSTLFWFLLDWMGTWKMEPSRCEK